MLIDEDQAKYLMKLTQWEHSEKDLEEQTPNLFFFF